MTTRFEECPKCGCEMYARCEPEDEGGCFFDTATEEELNRTIASAFKKPEGFERVKTYCDFVRLNPLPFRLNFEKSSEDKLWTHGITKTQLLKIVEGNDYTQFAD